MDAIDTTNAWPNIDLFGKYNPAYNAWAATAFGGAVSRLGLLDFWAPGADPDDDGRYNALEAYLGSDPLTANVLPWAKLSCSNGELVLRWTKRTGSRGVEIAADWSATVSPWGGGRAHQSSTAPTS